LEAGGRQGGTAPLAAVVSAVSGRRNLARVVRVEWDRGVVVGVVGGTAGRHLTEGRGQCRVGRAGTGEAPEAMRALGHWAVGGGQWGSKEEEDDATQVQCT
jgi:hypothetical protein